jgi:hypothetical protein
MATTLKTADIGSTPDAPVAASIAALIGAALIFGALGVRTFRNRVVN